MAEWQRVRLRVRMVKGSTLTVGNFLSLENLNVVATLIMTLYVTINIHTDIYLYSRLIVMLASCN